MLGQYQAETEKEYLAGFMNDGSQRIGQDAPKGDPALPDRRDDPGKPRLGQNDAAADLATSVAVETAMPIWAWRNAGASLAPSPHMPTVWPAF